MERHKRTLWFVAQSRPLLILGIPGMFVLLVGLTWGVRVIFIFRRANALAVGYAMISVLLSIIGSLALLTALILHSIRRFILDTAQASERTTGKPGVLRRAFRFVNQYQPLLMFGGPGTVLALAGMVIGMRVVDIYARTQALAIGHTLVGMLLSIVGSLGVLAGIILYWVRGFISDLVQSRENHKLASNTSAQTVHISDNGAADLTSVASADKSHTA